MNNTSDLYIDPGTDGGDTYDEYLSTLIYLMDSEIKYLQEKLCFYQISVENRHLQKLILSVNFIETLKSEPAHALTAFGE